MQGWVGSYREVQGWVGSSRGAGLGGELERCRAGWGAREVQGWVGSAL